MNNFYTLQSLVAELRYKIPGNEITEVLSFQKDRIDLFLNPGENGKLSFIASSPGTALFLDPKAGKPMRNAASFFPEIHGIKIANIGMMSDADRLIRLTLEGTSHELVFKPFSSRPNLFLVKGGTIQSAFKDDAGVSGRPAPQPHPPDSKQLATASRPDQPLKKRIIAIDKQFPRGLIDDIADASELDGCSDDELRNHIRQLQKKLLKPDQVCITAEGNLSLLPPSYLSHPPERTFDSVNDAVRSLYLERNREWRLLPRKNELLKKLKKRLRGLEKQEEQFYKEPERLHKAEILEHYGHLLMSQPNPNSTIQQSYLSVSDWAEDGKEITIPVSTGLTLIEQAQRYYEKAAAIKKEVAVSATKKNQIRAQKKEISDRLAEVGELSHPAELERWLKNHRERLQQIGLAASRKKQETRPYREVSAGNYDVWIGKSAKSNDEMLKLAHKEDIWMHVRGAAGSHVIVRNGGSPQWPENQVLMKAAAYAAAYSRQSGSSLVPVMMAKRKHVRKPKGAQPGAVTVTNELVEMVKPAKPEMSGS